MDFSDLIEARRSVRKYQPAAISASELEAIVTDALEAPSWKNTEVTRYHAAIDEAAKARAFAALPSFNVASSQNAAALVAVAFKRGESGYFGDAPANELGEGWGVYDSGIATGYFVLAAKNRGWDTLILGLRDEAATRRAFGIPADETLVSVIALGRAAAESRKPPRRSAAETMHVC